MLTELWLNLCKIKNMETVSCPFTPPQSAMCQIALISDLIMAAGGNADVCAKTSFKLKFSRASLWSSWRSLSFRPLSRSTSYKRGNRKLEWKTLWSPSWTLFSLKYLQKGLNNFGTQRCCQFFPLNQSWLLLWPPVSLKSALVPED